MEEKSLRLPSPFPSFQHVPKQLWRLFCSSSSEITLAFCSNMTHFCLWVVNNPFPYNVQRKTYVLDLKIRLPWRFILYNKGNYFICRLKPWNNITLRYIHFPDTKSNKTIKEWLEYFQTKYKENSRKRNDKKLLYGKSSEIYLLDPYLYNLLPSKEIFPS